jgi:hypothetical protein
MQEELNTYRYHRNGNIFTWWGGPYIEVAFENSSMPYDVYNVWDYAKDVPTIERSMRGLVNFIDEKFEEEGEEWGRLS